MQPEQPVVAVPRLVLPARGNRLFKLFVHAALD
jgi:hypothetical protein